MEENPYRAPTGAGETLAKSKSTEQRLSHRVWFVAIFFWGWVAAFVVEGALFAFQSVSSAAEYFAGREPSLHEAVIAGALAVLQFAVSAFIAWCAKGWVRDVRRSIEDYPSRPAPRS